MLVSDEHTGLLWRRIKKSYITLDSSHEDKPQTRSYNNLLAGYLQKHLKNILRSTLRTEHKAKTV